MVNDLLCKIIVFFLEFGIENFAMLKSNFYKNLEGGGESRSLATSLQHRW